MGKIGKRIERSGQWLLLLGVVGLLYAVAQAGAAWMLGQLSEKVVQLGWKQLLQLGGLTVLVVAAQMALEYAYKFLEGKFGSAGRRQLQDACADALAQAPVPWLAGYGGGDLLGRLQNELEVCVQCFCSAIPTIVANLLGIGVCAAAMMALSAKLALIYIVVTLLVVALQMLLSKPVQTSAQTMQRLRGQANAMARDMLSQRETVKAYNARSFLLGRYDGLLRPWQKAQVKAQAVASPIRGIGLLSGMLPTVLLCVMGAQMVRQGNLSVGAFMGIYFMASMLLNTTMHFVDQLVEYRQGAAAAQRLNEILEAPREQALSAPPEKGGQIAFEDVWFRYGEAGDWVLKGVSFAVEQGEKIAFVGPSGCGKSTVLRLMEGFLQPQKGRILMDGQPYERLGAAVRHSMAFVPQQPFLFSGSLEENIFFGRQISEGEKEQIYADAGVQSFLPKLPQGAQTLVGEGGTSLSLGQSQRAAIARGLAKKAGLLALDEATSALDAQSDAHIRQTIANLPQELTVATVTHRLAGLDEYDRIYVMEAGQIVEQGRHQELLAQGGLYASLYNRGEDAE